MEEVNQEFRIRVISPPELNLMEEYFRINHFGIKIAFKKIDWCFSMEAFFSTDCVGPVLRRFFGFKE